MVFNLISVPSRLPEGFFLYLGMPVALLEQRLFLYSHASGGHRRSPVSRL